MNFMLNISSILSIKDTMKIFEDKACIAAELDRRVKDKEKKKKRYRKTNHKLSFNPAYGWTDQNLRNHRE